MEQVSRFHSLTKDTLVNLLETLAPKFTFEYADQLNIYLRESSASLLIFSVQVDELEEFDRFSAIIDVLSGKVDQDALKRGDKNVKHAPYYLEENENWSATVRIFSPDYGVHYGLGVSYQKSIFYFLICELSGDDMESYKLNLPFSRCDLPSLISVLKKILVELKLKEEKRKENYSRGHGNYGSI